MLDIAGYMDFEENRLSLQYAQQDHVNSMTTGTYYTRGGTAPNYYYTEVSLPSEYMDGEIYYKIDGVNLTEESVAKLYATLQYYFYNYFKKEWLKNQANQDEEKIKQTDEGMEEALTKGTEKITALQYLLGVAETNIDKNLNTFNFIKKETRELLFDFMVDANISDKEVAINTFLDEMWNQVGRTPLQQLYLEAYKKRQAVNESDYGEGEESSYVGNSQKDSENYGHYYPVVLFINSINKAISQRDKAIND